MVELAYGAPSTGTSELFQGLSSLDSQNILSTSNRRMFPSGQEIFHVGEPKQTVFLLAKGLAKVGQVDPAGKEVILWLNGPGQIIGSLNLAGGSHSTSARAVQCCHIVTWTLSAFEGVLDRFPDFLKNVQKALARQSAELSSRICDISTTPAWLCMGRSLIRLTEQLGQRVDEHFEIEVTQEALAQITGTTLFNVNHQLSSWEFLGFVLRRGYTIVIRDLPALKKLCGVNHSPV